MRKILIVDDESSTADIARQKLQMEGKVCEITAEENGEDALRLISEGTYDMVITNYLRAGGVNGIKIAEAALARGVGRVIINTSSPGMVKLPPELVGKVEVMMRTTWGVRDAIAELLEKQE